MGYIVFLFIAAVLVLTVVRTFVSLWKTLRAPEGTWRFWRENKSSFKAIALVLGLLMVGAGSFFAAFLFAKIRVAQTAYLYLGTKYGSVTDFSLEFAATSERARTNSPKTKFHQVGYAVGTNTGILTIERGSGTNGPGYRVTADEPK
jgi:hypothetical protein